MLHLSFPNIAKKWAKTRPFDRFLNPCDSPRDIPSAFIGPKAGESDEGRMGASGNPVLAG